MTYTVDTKTGKVNKNYPTASTGCPIAGNYKCKHYNKFVRTTAEINTTGILLFCIECGKLIESRTFF